MLHKKLYQLFILSSALFIQISNAQNLNYPLNYELNNTQDKFILKSDQGLHTSLRPLNQQFSSKVVDPSYHDSTKVYSDFHMKFLKEHFVQIIGPDYAIYIDPLFTFEVGGDFLDTSGRGTLRDDGGTFYTNTRGAQIMGNLGNKFSFYSSFYENQAFFPDYIRLSNYDRAEYVWNGNSWGQQLSVVPGQGRAKEYKGSGFDYAMASGYISFAPHQNVNLQFGHGKHFIGNGYRSLLLSDNAFNYPYWSFRTALLDRKINYNFIYAYMQNLYRVPEHSAPEATFIRKNGGFTHISFAPSERIELALFEGTIWNVYDDSLGSQAAPLTSYIPVFGLSSILNGLDNENNNVVLGLTAKIKITDSLMAYGQLMLDDLSSKRFGFQIGLKWFDAFLPGLDFTTEFNKVSPYSYAHSNRWQGYHHYNQAIAHPYGAGFFEWASYLRYPLPNRFWISYKFTLANRVNELPQRNGGDIFNLFDPTAESNGVYSTLQFHQLRAGYKANIKTNMNIYAGTNYRLIGAQEGSGSMYWFVGISTDLINKYYDY